MIAEPEHIETVVVSRPQGICYGRMYSMHKYWSKKPPDVIAHYIERYSREGDVVLDPFCGSGVVAGEALRLGRRAVVIDLNPMATFITRTTLAPVNLSRLHWSFQDVRSACESAISALYTTTCTVCGATGSVDFVNREGEEPVVIAYRCACSPGRLFKAPDQRDRNLDRATQQADIPYWYPEGVPLPLIQKERYDYVHELFTRRNLIALSMILHAIEATPNEPVRHAMKLAFTAALDKCSRLKPLSEPRNGRSPTLSQGWVAVRFYAPRKWQEVNPWLVFQRSFERVYQGKVDSNIKLSHVSIGSAYSQLETGECNVIVLQGSSEEVMARDLPDGVVDYVLTDPPLGNAVQYLPLSTLWGAWLRLQFDYDREIVVASRRGKSASEYSRRMAETFRQLARVAKKDSYVHVFCHDIKGPYLHEAITLLREAGIAPESIVHRPPAGSFDSSVRSVRTRNAQGTPHSGTGNYGSFVIEACVTGDTSLGDSPISVEELRAEIRKLALSAVQLRGGEASLGTVLHSVSQNLGARELRMFAQHSAEDFLRECVSNHVTWRHDMLRLSSDLTPDPTDLGMQLREAVLDAAALVADKKDTKNPILQRVLGRFQSSGVVYDDVEFAYRQISGQDLKDAPLICIGRFATLLCEFGRRLGFECPPTDSENTIIWAKQSAPPILFTLGRAGAEVSMQLPDGGSERRFIWGNIRHIQLERAMYEWCKRNSDASNGMICRLNPPEEPGYGVDSGRMEGLGTSGLLRLRVLDNFRVCPDHFLMRLKLPRTLELDPRPGQFFHVICDPDGVKGERYPLTLRRPFSIHGAGYPSFDRRLLASSGDIPQEIRAVIERWPCEIDFLYRVVGKGTAYLSKMREGAWLDVLGPRGNGFDVKPDSKEIAVIVAGGIGVAPLVALAERLRFLDREIHMYLGAMREDLLMPAFSFSRPDSAVTQGFRNGTAEFRQLIRQEFVEIGVRKEAVHICTEDETEGERGYVTDILEQHFAEGTLPGTGVRIYACGPKGMLRAVSDIATRYGVECEVLMEERMACGIGACMSCTCATQDAEGVSAKKRVCRDGPVFRAADIVWD